MGYGIKLKVWGEYACFTRPEMKSERVSYDVMTPSAARGILQSIYWKPAIEWIVDSIHVIKEIRFESIRRNEVGSKIPAGTVQQAINGTRQELYQQVENDRQQRASLVLKDVAYIIEAHFEMTDKTGETDTPEKHYNVALRRMRKGQHYLMPYLGCREFPAHFSLIEEELPDNHHNGEKDLGWMLLDIDYQNKMNPVFFRAQMKDGKIEVPRMNERG